MEGQRNGVCTEMTRHYLVYWRSESVGRARARHPLLDHASSSQFRLIDSGDVLWFVTVRRGKLFLVGKLLVGERTDSRSAVRVLGRDIVHTSRYVALAKPGTEEEMRDIPMDDIVNLIRFNSTTNDRFTIFRGKINPQQMQMKRQLTDSSCRLINAKWSSHSTKAPKQDT